MLSVVASLLLDGTRPGEHAGAGKAVGKAWVLTGHLDGSGGAVVGQDTKCAGPSHHRPPRPRLEPAVRSQAAGKDTLVKCLY